ncbi:tetratricopeptide repeat protein [Shimia sp.]|uniref:tetratricopeptide repeat protein n=1 Tax=Shimia sp. TaxID=1954381 RepID=UPI00356B2F5E
MASVEEYDPSEEPAGALELLPFDQRLPIMDLRTWPANRFKTAFVQQIITLSSAHGPEKPSVLLDFAELYLSQMMLYEAQSVLSDVRPQNFAQEIRHKALREAAALLAGSPVGSVDESPLMDPTRPDSAFWLSLHAIATSDGALLNDSLTDGFVGLTHQPKPVLRVVLPLFIEAAVALKKEPLASQAVRLIDELPDLTLSPTGYFLRGRVAELQGNNKTALDSYFEAAAGWDRYAARARLALADMALRDRGRGALLAARDVLAQGADSWRGDSYELAVLEKLAAVHVKLGDAKPGLVTYGKIAVRFPVSEASEDARAKASELLDRVYGDGSTGEIPLGSWMDIHLKILPLFKEHKDFPAYVEQLADRALSLGASSLASTEYERALRLMQHNEILFEAAQYRQQSDRVLLKLARAQRKMGKLALARDTLDQIDPAEDPAFREELFALKASVLAEIGDQDRFLRTYVARPDASQLRNMARALAERQDWSNTIQFYTQLQDQFPEAFSAEDATYLLIAARRSGDRSTENRVVADFPGLTQSSEWIALAKGIQETPAELLPLRQDAAQSRLESLERTLKKIENSGF